MKSGNNKIGWFFGWFLFFSPLLYFSHNVLFVKIVRIAKYKNEYKKTICNADTSMQNSEAITGINMSYFSKNLTNNKLVYLTFPSQKGLTTDFEQDYLGKKWAYAHPEESNFGIGETPEEIKENAKIKVWYHPSLSEAYVIYAPEYEEHFPASEIIWRYIKWFIGFTILPFYFFCRWIIEWISVKLLKK